MLNLLVILSYLVKIVMLRTIIKKLAVFLGRNKMKDDNAQNNANDSKLYVMMINLCMPVLAIDY